MPPQQLSPLRTLSLFPSCSLPSNCSNHLPFCCLSSLKPSTHASHLCLCLPLHLPYFPWCRYIFRNAQKVGLQELGPRLTLKLRSIQKGTFDSKYGEYIWVHKVRHACLKERGSRREREKCACGETDNRERVLLMLVSLSFILEKKNGHKQKKIPLMINIYLYHHYHHTTLINSIVLIYLLVFTVTTCIIVCTHTVSRHHEL